MLGVRELILGAAAIVTMLITLTLCKANNVPVQPKEVCDGDCNFCGEYNFCILRDGRE